MPEAAKTPTNDLLQDFVAAIRNGDVLITEDVDGFSSTIHGSIKNTVADAVEMYIEREKALNEMQRLGQEFDAN